MITQSRQHSSQKNIISPQPRSAGDFTRPEKNSESVLHTIDNTMYNHLAEHLTQEYAYFFNWAFLKTRDYHYAQDLVQIGFLKLCEHPEINLRYAKTWMISVIRNQYLTDKRKHSALTQPDMDTHQASDTALPPELSIDLESALATLTPREKQIFTDWITDDIITGKELAQQYQRPVATIRRILHTAKTKLRKPLAAYR